MSFNIRDIDAEYVKLYGGHYNLNLARVAQGETRQRKSGYRPLFMRAKHDEPGKGGRGQ